jgi:hypothetical protein
VKFLALAVTIAWTASINAQDLTAETPLWLVQPISITTNTGVTGLLPGTKVTLVKNNGTTLTVSDGTHTFEIYRANATTDATVARKAAGDDYSAQAAVAAASEKEVKQLEKSQADDDHEKAKVRYRLQGLVKQKFQDAILLERPSVYSGQRLPDDMYIASDKAAGIRYAEPGYLYLIGYPDAQKLADDDPVDCVAADAGVHTVNGSTYHAYTFVSK